MQIIFSPTFHLGLNKLEVGSPRPDQHLRWPSARSQGVVFLLEASHALFSLKFCCFLSPDVLFLDVCHCLFCACWGAEHGQMGLVSMVAVDLLSSGFKCYASSNFETCARAVLTQPCNIQSVFI